MKGEYDKAIADFTAAIGIDPKNATPYEGRAGIYAKSGQYDKAIADYTQALWIGPKRAEMYYDRGKVYRTKADWDNAIGDLAEAVRLEPKNAGFRNDLAWLLATCPQSRLRDGQRAIDHATTACALTKWNDFGCLDTLAAAYAEAGKFAKAVEFEQKALDMAARPADKEALRGRLQLFRDGKPYREPAKK